jgi:hypothetical protein
MFIIFGWKIKESDLGQVLMPYKCYDCSINTWHMLLYQKYFTLFFLPIFKTSTTYVLQCQNCGAKHEIPKDEALQYIDIKQ